MSTKNGADSTNAPDLDDDEYVAQLLAKDARDSSLRYSTLGMNAFIPLQRPFARAPKPNTRFLRNILRETDSHNASLKRKEEEEARERMRALRHGHEPSSGSTAARDLYDVRAAKRRRVEASTDKKYESGGHSRRQKGREEESRHTSHDREREGRREQRMRRRENDESSDDEERARRHKSSRSRRHKKEDDRSHRSHSRRHAEHSHSSDKHRSSDDDRERRSHRRQKRHRSHSSSPSRTRRRPPERSSSRKGSLKGKNESHGEQHHPRKHRTSTTSRETRAAAEAGKSPPLPQTSPRHSNPEPRSRDVDTIDPSVPGSASASASDSDSDPLESLIGPLPPSAENDDTPPLRSRGRGAYKKNKSNNIDAHFASGYDPALDVRPDDEDEGEGNTANTSKSPSRPRRRPVAGLATAEDDDWDMALEALRDRALWRRKGADRLRAAGFDEGVIEKWAGNGAFAGLDGGAGGGGHRDMGGRDRDVEDVKWVKRGEKREWDRGKVLTDDGHVDVRPEW
ncbi:uncharacterized protein BDCG_06234 [Blastomyces dermatitidis ER-3]|uniref:Pre-mRNA-splicing factor 38B n=1 Tax=Ajellomyces dermatitidis (strain ER-3 / ATCC MYA-2586) TaxID=559297 RepID=A0ABM9YIG8_AJEDR|nr:uncharacterized protein BDCG_06234 [Blastomyces dermatitidis ER-3]EEQ91114.1 hypothetical protein BDCG_06234 [Blastomyces dermatitidis ER-3]